LLKIEKQKVLKNFLKKNLKNYGSAYCALQKIISRPIIAAAKNKAIYKYLKQKSKKKNRSL